MDILMVNGTEYTVLNLLGKRKGGYSYLVEGDGGQFTLKQIHHEPCDYYTFGDKLQSELDAYKHLKSLGIPLPELLQVDTAAERILKEYIPGPTIYDLVKAEQMEPDYFRQMEQMCRILYAAGTNIDYFPTNFVVHQGRLVYIDYECNGYMQQWDFEHWGIKYWSKTPEFLEYMNNH